MPRAKKDTSAEVNKEISFEDAMKRLDEISSKLEKGDAALDEALSLFEEGTALVGSCNKLLDNAELKVTQMTKGTDGAPVETELQDESV